MDKQTAKLVARIAENLPAMEKEVMQVIIDNPRALKKFLSGLCTLVDIRIRTIIHVDRSIPPNYPSFMKRVADPDLQYVGPTEYDLAKVEPYLNYGQQHGSSMLGTEIYKQLKMADTLRQCLGLRDLEEIQKMGLLFCRALFPSKEVYAWRGVVVDASGRAYVPCLTEDSDKVVIGYRSMDDHWKGNHPALRFVS